MDWRFRPPKPRIVIPANSIPVVHILNFVLFTLALLIIISLNLPLFSTASTKAYDWTRIRYRSPNSTPQAHGVCPGIEKTTKPVLIIARVSSESATWHEPLKEKYHLCVYTSDAPRSSPSSSSDTTPVLETPANRAHEALPYLTFIIDNYASLPEHLGMVFIHGSRFAWHNDHPDYDNLALLHSLNVSSALADSGYANLKCDWTASTCVKDGVEPQAGWTNQARRVIEPWNAKVVSDAEMAGSMMQVFGGGSSSSSKKTRTRLSGSDILRSQCCAQFVVARKNIVQHTCDEYIALRQWLLDGTRITPSSSSSKESRTAVNAAKAAAHPDDRIAGRIMSYLWHILFLPRDQIVQIGLDNDSLSSSSSQAKKVVDEGEVAEQLSLAKLNALACPSARDCYCRLYGRCALTSCREDESRCDGQYRVPPGFRLAKDVTAAGEPLS
ncbi:hypothetical protein DV736_g4174, partial [Chaetothyriales sp. CBS 134916]